MRLDIIFGRFPERETNLRKERGENFKVPLSLLTTRTAPEEASLRACALGINLGK